MLVLSPGLELSLSLRASEFIFFACPKKTEPKERTPRKRALQASCLSGSRGEAGFFDSTSCAGEKQPRIPARLPSDFPPRLAALQGPHRSAILAAEPKAAALLILSPVVAPSSGGSRQGKARLFERMGEEERDEALLRPDERRNQGWQRPDFAAGAGCASGKARVRAGRRILSNAVERVYRRVRSGEADARTPGVLLFAYISLGQARESRSAALKAMSKALDRKACVRGQALAN